MIETSNNYCYRTLVYLYYIIDTGAWEDTLKALLLDPNDKSSIPLIARLFPGKTASELYHSDLANDLRPSLLPSKHQQSGLTESTSRASLLNKLPEDLTIHTAEEEKEEMNGEKKESGEGEAGSGSAHSGTDKSPHISPPSPPSATYKCLFVFSIKYALSSTHRQ